MSSLFIKNGRVIDPVNNIDSVANVLVVDGVIAEVINFQQMQTRL